MKSIIAFVFILSLSVSAWAQRSDGNSGFRESPPSAPEVADLLADHLVIEGGRGPMVLYFLNRNLIPGLREELSSGGSGMHRTAAAALLMRLDPDGVNFGIAFPILENALRTSQNKDERFVAASALAYQGYGSAEVINVLMESLRHNSRAVIIEAASGLGSLRLSAMPALPLLAEMLFDYESAHRDDDLLEVTERAFWEIVSYSPEMPMIDVPPMLDNQQGKGLWILNEMALKGDHPEVARARIYAIARGEEPAFPEVRRIATEFLYHLDMNKRKEDQPVDLLLEMLNNRDTRDSWPGAMMALGHIGPPFAEKAVPRLWEIANGAATRNPDVAVAALVALLRICPNDSAALDQMVHFQPASSFEKQRDVLIIVMARNSLDRPPVRDAFRQLLAKSPADSTMVLRGLLELPEPDEEFGEDVLAMLSRKHRTGEEVNLSARLLASWKMKESIPVLSELALDCDWWQGRRACLYALAKLHAIEALDTALQACNDPQPYVRRAAQDTLVALTQQEDSQQETAVTAAESMDSQHEVATAQ